MYSHQNHRFKPAEKAATEIKKKLSSSRKKLEARLKTFQCHAETIAKVEQHVTTYPNQLKASITSTFDELIKALHQRKQTLLNEVDAKYNSFSKVLRAEKNTVEMTLCSLQAGIKFANQLKEDKTNLEVAVLGTQAIKSMKELHSVSWDSKAVDGLGPLVYLRQEKKNPPPKDNLQLINSIGHVLNVDADLTLRAEGYSSAASLNTQSEHSSSSKITRCLSFKKNGMYSVTAKYLDIVFPAVTMSAKVSLVGTGIIPSKISKYDDKWEITFHTPNAGKYEVKVQLKRGKETIDKMITIDLKQKHRPVHTYNEYDDQYDDYRYCDDYHDYDEYSDDDEFGNSEEYEDYYGYTYVDYSDYDDYNDYVDYDDYPDYHDYDEFCHDSCFFGFCCYSSYNLCRYSLYDPYDDYYND